IDAGVQVLRGTQGNLGTWSRDNHHLAGYAALPGLTLLECGVPASDPAVQRAAAFVRWAAPKMDKTYELSLSILFLDRLGNPKDRALIETLAVRLIAGQTVTGGWHYSCPIVSTSDHKKLINILRHLEPPKLFNPLDVQVAQLNPLGKGQEQPGLNPLPKGSQELGNPVPGGSSSQNPLPGGSSSGQNPLPAGGA